ncbi:MAG: Eco47II family restriction endonuclease [Daejeonella sp.]
MANEYLSFITDAHFLQCISNLHTSYINAKNNIDKSKFYKNKIDTID